MTFAQFYDSNKGNKTMIALATRKLIRIPFDEKLKGKEKIIELDDSDMESNLPTYLIPSMMYTFMYASKNDKVFNMKFSDIMPLVLVLKVTQTHIEGINLNLMTPGMRVKFLDSLDKMCKHFYTKPPIDFTTNQYQENSVLVKICMSGASKKNVGFAKILEKYADVDVSYCYRKYSLDNVKNIKYIEYPDYKYITLFDTSESISGINQKMLVILNTLKQAIGK